jgi:16S rRNA G966 N2-methylase RsmD
VRQAVLNLLAAELPGCRWLDLCCGSGVMACEALQRGASEVVAIERDRRVAAVARANLEAVAAGMGRSSPRVRVIQADARRWLASHAPASGGGGRTEIASDQEQGGDEVIAAGRLSVDPEADNSRRRDRRPGESGAAARDDLSPSADADRQCGGDGQPVDRAERELPFDLIYCDPPWPAGLHAPLSEAVVRGGWIRPGGTLVWECPSEEIPVPPAGWTVRDQRRYGGSSVVLLEPV